MNNIVTTLLKISELATEPVKAEPEQKKKGKDKPAKSEKVP